MSIEAAPGQNCKLRKLEKEEILARLLELEAMLAPAFKKSYGEIEAIDALVLGVEGKVMVFVGDINNEINVAFILEPIKYPRKWVLNVLAYAGQARKFYQCYAELRAWVKAEGYDELRGSGDEATYRLARKIYGWKEIYRVYADPLK